MEQITSTISPKDVNNNTAESSRAASSPANSAILGTLNVKSTRRIAFLSSGALTSGADVNLSTGVTKHFVNNTTWLNITRGWPVLSINYLKVTLIPRIGSRGCSVVMHTAWYPNAEADNTDGSTMCYNPTYDYHHYTTPLTHSLLPTVTLICPLGQAGLQHVVKAPSIVPYFPKLCISHHLYGSDGITPAGRAFYDVKYEVELNIGL